MKRLLLVLALTAGTVAATTPAEAGYNPTHEPVNEFIVVGDSISSPAYGGYDPATAWWGKLSRATGAHGRTYSQGGSGFGKPGACTGTTIGQRINHPVVSDRMEHARFVIVAAGVNDYRECFTDENGVMGVRPIPDEKLDAAVGQAMDDLDQAVSDNSKVYVAVPYGDKPSLKPYLRRIIDAVAHHATAHGFRYVSMANTLNGDKSNDGVHPNAKGSQAIYAAFYYGTDLRLKFPR